MNWRSVEETDPVRPWLMKKTSIEKRTRLASIARVSTFPSASSSKIDPLHVGEKTSASFLEAFNVKSVSVALLPRLVATAATFILLPTTFSLSGDATRSSLPE